MHNKLFTDAFGFSIHILILILNGCIFYYGTSRIDEGFGRITLYLLCIDILFQLDGLTYFINSEKEA